MTPPPDPDLYAGAVIGQCLGDAMGFPVEGGSTALCGSYVADILRPGRLGHARRPPFEIGQYTDDSQLARTLLESYVARARFDPADFAARLAELFTSARIVGRGRTTETAALKLAAGVPWDQAGTPAPAAGNGSAMRAGPVGLMFPADARGLARAATDQGRVTHADPRCAAGAIAIAASVAFAMTRPDDAAETVLTDVAALARPHDAVLAEAIGALPGRLALAPEAAAAILTRVGVASGARDDWPGISPFVTTSVLWALYAYWRSPTDYWETICTAIGVGGDVDTTAAMAGAIGGARNGLAGLPTEAARLVNDRGEWGYDALVRLAGAARSVCAGASDG